MELANSAASSPPAPPRISTITFLSSSGSRGSSSIFSSSDSSSLRRLFSAYSSRAISRSSGSLSSRAASASAKLFSHFLYSLYFSISGVRFFCSLINSRYSPLSEMTDGSESFIFISSYLASALLSLSNIIILQSYGVYLSVRYRPALTLGVDVLADNGFYLLLTFRARNHEAVSASRAAQLEIRAASQNLHFIAAAAGVRLFHHQHIPYPDIHAFTAFLINIVCRRFAGHTSPANLSNTFALTIHYFYYTILYIILQYL